jgi:integrase
MGAIRTTPSGYLYFDFRHRGVRCREYTTLKDSPANRKKMEQVLARVQAELTLGTFDYGAYFPRGSRAALFTRPPAPREDVAFQRFALQWYEQNKVSWKPSVAHEFLGTLKQHLLPRFDGRPVTEVTAADVKRLRLDLAQCPGRKGRPLSAKRINNICGVLRLILAEAADHFGIGNPFDAIKPLPVPKSDIDPFTFEEMDIFLRGVRPDFYNYYIVRFLTGMRTGEIDGLGWEHVDWINKKLRVRRSLYRGQFVPPKTPSSVRDIDILPPVEEVLRAQLQITGEKGSSVFCNRAGRPLDHNLITKRVWYPTLKRLGLRARTPYQTRHTAATLWLASGENPEWIARQLGHSTTTMLFQVYSRFVPNLTRQDGSAFLRLLEERATIPHRQPKAMLEGQAAEPTELDPVETGKDRS